MQAAQIFLFLAASLLFVPQASAETGYSVTGEESKNQATTSADTQIFPRKQKIKKRKKAKKTALQPEKPFLTEVTVPMAKGELEAEVASDQAQRDRANAPRTFIELGVSSWKPKRATVYSRIPGTTDFETKSIPSLDATVFAPLFGWRDLQLAGGLGFLALRRTATITGAGLNLPQDENGYILSARLGVTYSPYKFFADRVTPYFEAALLPSVLITRETSFDSGTSDMGVPFELGMGTLVGVYKTLSIDVGVSETLGKVQDSDFAKFAVRAGMRAAL